jgi:D-lactate dehydrogenase
MQIAFFDTKPYDKTIFDEVNTSYGFKIKYYKHHLTIDNAILAQGYDAVCIFVNDYITTEIINKLYEYNVQYIALRCSGFNNVDIKSAYGKIHVVRVPAYSPNAIAEHSVALMLTLNRKIHRAYNRTREANFMLTGLMGFDMYQKKAGVIGTGRIGKALIKILRGFDMQVMAFDPYPDKDFEKTAGCRYTSLDDLFRNSDIISLNCPLNKKTKYIINKVTIAKMKKGVMLINTGRGRLINTKDLIEGLKTGTIGYAGLDVYEEEADYFFEDLSNRIITDDILARLLTFNNVIVTSHQGFFTKEALRNIAETTLANLNSCKSGKKVIDNEICYRCGKSDSQCQKKQGKRCF